MTAMTAILDTRHNSKSTYRPGAPASPPPPPPPSFISTRHILWEEKTFEPWHEITTIWYVRPAKAQTSLRILTDWQSLCWSLKNSMTVKLLTELHLRFLRLKRGCTGSSESTLVKIPNLWKSRVAAHLKKV